MDRITIMSTLERYEEIQREHKIDLHVRIKGLIREYQEKYGADEWIEDFEQDYLQYHKHR